MKLDFIAYNNGNNKEKFKIIELDKKILALNQEIKQKKIIIQEHNKCLSIKNQILKKISLIQKEISGEKENNIKIKKKLGTTESKYILIKQDFENKFKSNQFSSTINKNSTKIFKKYNDTTNYFNQIELNAILAGVGGKKIIFKNILQRLNINENNRTKNLENQIQLFQQKQKMKIIKNKQLIKEINDIEKNNNDKDKEINKLKIELENLKKEYNKKNNINENNDDFDKENIDKITSKKINSNFIRIEIDANKNKDDNV